MKISQVIRHPGFPVLLIALGGVLFRLGFFLPGFSAGDQARFLRPDSAFYMYAAQELAAGRSYPGSVRAPGFSAAAAVLLRSTGSPFCISLFFSIAGGAAAVLVYCAGKTSAGHKTGLLAEAFYAFNLTGIVNAPMLLSDTLFGIFAALQLWLFFLFRESRRTVFFSAMMLTAALGTLVRPINLVWFLPALVLLFCTRGIAWRRKILAGAASVLLFWAVIAPWMARNAGRGAGFCVDVNTGAMLHQNGAMLLAEVNKSDFEKEKAAMLDRLDRLFSDKQRYPDEKSRADYRKKEYLHLIAAHPFIWLKQQFQWKILLPDAPTGFELLGLTKSDRGTMAVLARDGLWAAVDHYFDGKIHLPLLFLPFLAVAALTYAACAFQLFRDIFALKNDWGELLLFLAFVEYYLFLPGAITAPRYQIPALPLISVLAAEGLLAALDFLRKRRGELPCRPAERVAEDVPLQESANDLPRSGSVKF